MNIIYWLESLYTDYRIWRFNRIDKRLREVTKELQVFKECVDTTIPTEAVGTVNFHKYCIRKVIELANKRLNLVEKQAYYATLL
jgi:hypothetical protein